MENQRNELHWYNKLPEEESSSGKSDSRLWEKEVDMSEKKLPNLEKFRKDANQWVDEVAVLMKVDDRKDLAWNALRGVLHAIRDRLIPEEMFQLSAQLPMLIRGLFFEGYHFGDKPEKFHVDGLKNRIEDSFEPLTDIDSELVFKSVLLVLYDHISEGELQDIYGNMPKDIQELWDESLTTYTI